MVLHVQNSQNRQTWNTCETWPKTIAWRRNLSGTDRVRCSPRSIRRLPMAHDCPECWMICHCGTDIYGCQHYVKLECSAHREYCTDEDCPCRRLDDDYDDDDCGEAANG